MFQMLNNEEASKQIHAEYLLQYGRDSIVEIKNADELLFSQMIEDCSKQRFIEEKCEFYDDEELDNQTQANWIDLEGEGYGWVFVNYPKRKWHKVMRLRVLRQIKMLKERIADGEQINVVVVKSRDLIIYTFIDREISLSDLSYTFSKQLLM